MIWEQTITVIVMLCGIDEEGRVKCDIYFPDTTLSTRSMRIGNQFEVSLTNLDTSNQFYWVRKFKLKNLRTGEERSVLQYHVSG